MLVDGFQKTLRAWRWRWSDKFMFISEEGLDLGVLIAVVSVLRLWSRLGDTWLLQLCNGNVGLGFSSSVDDYLSEEEDS